MRSAPGIAPGGGLKPYMVVPWISWKKIAPETDPGLGDSIQILQ